MFAPYQESDDVKISIQIGSYNDLDRRSMMLNFALNL